MSKIAEHAVLNGMGKMTKIDSATLQVVLKDSTEAEKLKYSLIYAAPQTVLRLATGSPALLNVEFLVADAERTVEDLLIGLPVHRHLSVDAMTL